MDPEDTLIRQHSCEDSGSAAIDLQCWVAAGRFDGFYEHKLNVMG